ncbi:aldehyde-activating protein [Vibrio sp. OCN044]|uniref:Aldehyde-activating protein n=1 Tax=Vibrio tetraodonis subsp. pristinus TaxID=2695891 RepID=A0A6L8M1F5_9VIBR|nr:GFA family protein [Vibrio tetraodonis]MYM59352.1 aldehyde-activating protein [Vibrio tetraodonis subsp. pristinus]
MYKGSCLCGSIQFEIHGGITDPIYCHCSLCRKASGSAFATNGYVNNSDLQLNDKKGTLTYYESSLGKRKYFCLTCGAPIYSSNSTKPDKVRIRLGAIDTDIVERPISHNFITSKGNWEELETTLPVYEGHEPSRR